jgi:hypothetical protein
MTDFFAGSLINPCRFNRKEHRSIGANEPSFLLKDFSARKRAAQPSLTTWRPRHDFGIQN